MLLNISACIEEVKFTRTNFPEARQKVTRNEVSLRDGAHIHMQSEADVDRAM